jgi:hypothetical protein
MSIVNRVAESGLIQFDPATLVKDMELSVISLSDFLYEETILREKPFRKAISAHDWTKYTEQYVALQINPETLVPQWAAMLLTSCLKPYALRICLGDHTAALDMAYESALAKLKVKEFDQKNILIKGCSDGSVPDWVYVRLMEVLQPHANRIAYGEACSSVPLYKN